MLSGYLIVGLARKADFNYPIYVLHRVARIYPALVAMLVLCALSLIVLRGEVVTLGRFLGNVFLLNGAFGISHVQPINYVTWSVFFEFCFYLTFPIFFRSFGFWATVGISACVILALTLRVDGRFVRFTMFYAGVWLKLHQPGPNRPIPDWVVILLFLAVTTASMFVEKIWIFILLLAPAAALLADRALHTRGVINRLFSFRPLRMFGNISYSFYLFHPIGLLAGRYAVAPLHLSGLAWVVAMTAASFALSVVAAIASFWCFERPYFVLRKRRVVATAAMLKAEANAS